MCWRVPRVGGEYSHDAGLPLADYAHDMGVFCYLVHICRDVKKDALAGGDQLVTVPADVLAEHGLDAVELRGDLVGGDGLRTGALVKIC
ncbi:MAG: squalene/phytoene synthase family protein [Verrucomicrobiales bacterium]|nr:squalene/phytoene synthase family protein [Verrucomicrobiales bacterium]